MDRESLEKQFEQEMLRIYEEEKSQIGRQANYFFQAISELGGFETARVLLEKPHPSEGFADLWKANRLDLTVEALVLREPWRQLFEDRHLAIAEKRLKDARYDPSKEGAT